MIKLMMEVSLSSNKMHEELMSEILDKIEEAGMLPPYNNNHGESNYAVAMGVSPKILYSWESENEEE